MNNTFFFHIQLLIGSQSSHVNNVLIPGGFSPLQSLRLTLTFIVVHRPIPLFQRIFKHKCKDSCDNGDIMCQPTNFSQWRVLLASPDVRLKPFLPKYVHGKYMFPWENDYLRFPPLMDSKSLPDLALSTFTMAGGNGSGIACDVGQRLTGRLDVRDGYGRKRHDGMDEVRMWMVDSAHNKQRAVGQVTDFRNGSYGLEITCLWPGSVVKVNCPVRNLLLTV